MLTKVISHTQLEGNYQVIVMLEWETLALPCVLADVLMCNSSTIDKVIC